MDNVIDLTGLLPAHSPAHSPETRLADRLIAEYAGALPPGQVLSIVVRTHLLLSRGPSAVAPETRDACLENVVRRVLTDRLALLNRQSREIHEVRAYG